MSDYRDLDIIPAEDLINELLKRYKKKGVLIAHFAEDGDLEADWYSYWDGDFNLVTALLKYVEWDVAENFAATYLYDQEDDDDDYETSEF